jgi:acyl-CoA reductase-like NAD-dependent aldehyde dehydrogenase
LIHNVIGGRRVPAVDGAHRELIDPATGTGHDAESGAADVDAAVAAAR